MKRKFEKAKVTDLYPSAIDTLALQHCFPAFSTSVKKKVQQIREAQLDIKKWEQNERLKAMAKEEEGQLETDLSTAEGYYKNLNTMRDNVSEDLRDAIHEFGNTKDEDVRNNGVEILARIQNCLKALKTVENIEKATLAEKPILNNYLGREIPAYEDYFDKVNEIKKKASAEMKKHYIVPGGNKKTKYNFKT